MKHNTKSHGFSHPFDHTSHLTTQAGFPGGGGFLQAVAGEGVATEFFSPSWWLVVVVLFGSP